MDKKFITVKGTGTVSAKPDLIVVTMNLETKRPEYEATLECAAHELDSLRSAITSVGHEAETLITKSFSITTEYENYQKDGAWTSRFVGYRCVHSLQLEFEYDLQMLNKTISAITTSKASPHFEIAFSVKDKESLKKQLLENAVKDSTEKAGILARSAHVKLGAIARIDYSWDEIRFSSDSRVSFNEESSESIRALGAPLEIEPDNVRQSDSVSIVWEIETSE